MNPPARVERVGHVRLWFYVDHDRGLVEARVGHARLWFYVDHDRGLVDLASVRVPIRRRGRGEASAGIRYVISVADALGYPTTLLASPLDRRTSLRRLVALYRRFGFEVTGRAGNPAGDPVMIRPVPPSS